MKDSDQATDPLDGIKLVPEPSAELLNERQYLDYRSERERCLDWLLTFGKDPEKAEGYAKTTVDNRASRMDQFYRWVWDQEDGYTSNLTHDHADDYLRHLARQESSNAHKNACRKAVMMLYKWRHHQRGADPWEPSLSFSRQNQSTAPRDYLTREERSKIRDASLEYGSVPKPENVRGDDRDRFPWRDSGRSPFEILVAEVLLQRTTAAQVRQVYPDLVENYPTPEAMETASRDELGNAIVPLGLRKRARYLQTLAGQLVERHGGTVPNTYSELTELHGVGDYTAASVLVHAHGKEAAPVDTNVARILARVHGLDQGSKETNEEIRELVETLCPSDRRSDFVHALLDLGATACTARSPSCSDRPVSAYCRSQSESPKHDG